MRWAGRDALPAEVVPATARYSLGLQSWSRAGVVPETSGTCHSWSRWTGPKIVRSSGAIPGTRGDLPDAAERSTGLRGGSAPRTYLIRGSEAAVGSYDTLWVYSSSGAKAVARAPTSMRPKPLVPSSGGATGEDMRAARSLTSIRKCALGRRDRSVTRKPVRACVRRQFAGDEACIVADGPRPHSFKVWSTNRRATRSATGVPARNAPSNGRSLRVGYRPPSRNGGKEKPPCRARCRG